MAPDALDGLACLSGRRYEVRELPGGLTNHNRRVTTTDDGPPVDVVVRRWVADAAVLLIDRDAEHANSRRAAEVGVGAPVVEYRPDLGCLVVEHLPGRTLGDADLRDEAVLARAAGAVRRLHAGPAFDGVFDMALRQRHYRRALDGLGGRVPPGYDEAEPAWRRLCDALAAHPPAPVPCHDDLLAANLLDDGVVVRLVDYEYAGQGDAAFDLGNTAAECCFDDDGPALVEAWVTAYAGRPDPALLARVRAQVVASRYGWALWGFLQEVSSSEHHAGPDDVDFRAWGCERWERAAAAFAAPGFDRLLDEVGGAGGTGRG